MDLYAKSQLSYLILNCLQERDFYGLDIISEISTRSDGKINLKKPSVYSNLTRMEKQGYVSAYLKNSDLGPNRKYYSITEKGRNFFQELNEYFNRNNIDVFRDFSDVDEKQPSPTNNTIKEETVETETMKNEEENSQYDTAEDYFDFSSLNEEKDHTANQNNEYFSNYITTKVIVENNETNETNEKLQETFKKDETSKETTNQFEKNNVTDESITEQIEENEHEVTADNEEKEIKISQNIEKDEIKAITDDEEENVGKYNQRIYDFSKDLNKFKNKKTFADDQISINIESPLSESERRTNQNIQAFKSSLEEEKKNDFRINQYDFSKQMEYRFTKKEENIEEIKDDAKFITDRIDYVQSAKKITPPKLKIVENTNLKEDRLPPPKRDISIDPSHKEILSKLYSKTKDNNSDIVREDAIYDYVDLKDYYNGQNISFSEYKKPIEKFRHNTNKIYLILSLFVFLIASIASALTYIILKYTNQLNPSTNFLFVLLPALFIFDIVWEFYNFKVYSSWFPKQMFAPWKIWSITILVIGSIVALNTLWAYGLTPFSKMATTIILPIVLTLVWLPARYYLKRFMLVKYWR